MPDNNNLAGNNKVKNKAIAEAANILKALANSNRLQVLYLIAEEELSVGYIEKAVKLSQSALSQHLAVLRSYDIVQTRRAAQTIYYKLKDEKVRKIMELLRDLY